MFEVNVLFADVSGGVKRESQNVIEVTFSLAFSSLSNDISALTSLLHARLLSVAHAVCHDAHVLSEGNVRTRRTKAPRLVLVCEVVGYANRYFFDQAFAR
jgi:hypothetical protein